MANPAVTTRVTPTGRAMTKGYRSLIAFALDSDISFWEKGTKPPGYDGGDQIDVTTMHNGTYRVFAPQALITLTPVEVRVAWISGSYAQILAIMNIEGSITVSFPSGNSPVSFFGFLKQFDPDALTDTNQPEANIVVVPTAWDPANNLEVGLYIGT